MIYRTFYIFKNKDFWLICLVIYYKPKAKITVPIYSERHEVAGQTVSRDLIDLEENELFLKVKTEITMVYKLIHTEKMVIL